MHTHPKESEILALRDEGLASYQIAQRLGLGAGEVTDVIWHAIRPPARHDRVTLPAPRETPLIDELEAQATKTKPPKAPKPDASAAEVKRLERALKKQQEEVEGLRDELKGLKAAKAKIEQRLTEREASIAHRDVDNVALMERMGTIAKQLGCRFDEIEQAVSDLTEALAEESERREAAEADHQCAARQAEELAATLARVERERNELRELPARLATLLLCEPHEVEHRAAHVLSLYVRAASAQQDAEDELEDIRELATSGGPVETDEVTWSEWMTARAASLKLGIKSRETIWRYCATGRTASGRRVETRPVTDDDDVYPTTADLVRFEIREGER